MSTDGGREGSQTQEARKFLQLVGEGTGISRYEFECQGSRSLEFDIRDLASGYSNNYDIFVTPHRHSFAHILWLANDGRLSVDFIDYHHAANSLYFIASNQVHFFPRDANPEGVLICFNEAYLNASALSSTKSCYTDLFDSFLGIPCVHVDDEDTVELQSILDAMLAEARRPVEERSIDLLVCLLSALVLLGFRSKYASQSSSHVGTDQEIFFALKQLINRDFCVHHQVAHYASELCVSEHKLSEICRRHAGMSAKQLIVERIMLEAKRLLAYSELNISQVAHKLGFKDALYFSRAFKSSCGMPPSSFRERISA